MLASLFWVVIKLEMTTSDRRAFFLHVPRSISNCVTPSGDKRAFVVTLSMFQVVKTSVSRLVKIEL